MLDGNRPDAAFVSRPVFGIFDADMRPAERLRLRLTMQNVNVRRLNPRSMKGQSVISVQMASPV